MDKVEELEKAILERANRLAEQYRQQGYDARSDLLREAAHKLHLREQHEVRVAQSLAERAYRRQVQAQELKLQARLDQLRWDLITGVGDRLQEVFTTLIGDEDRYLEVLQGLLKQGAAAIDADELVVEVNAADHARLSAVWSRFAAAVPEQRITLGDEYLPCLGGLRLRTPDNRQRLDNTFEGRMRRMQGMLHQAIQERLLPPLADDPAFTIGSPS